MRTMLFSLLCVMTACAVDGTAAGPAVDTGTTTSTTASDVQINPKTDLTEPVYVNGRQCKLVFKGGLTPQTEVYAIWAVGVNGIVDAPYNTPQRPNLYAVFGTNPAPNEIHHVDGYNQFDHYHVVDTDHAGNSCDHDGAPHNTNWDVLTYWPGPNYNAATYVSAKSVDELQAQSAAGILSPMETLPEIGFPELVLHAPVDCSPPRDRDD